VSQERPRAFCASSTAPGAVEATQNGGSGTSLLRPPVVRPPAPGGAPAQRRAAARALGEVALSVRAELRMLGPDLVAAIEPADSKAEDCFNRAIGDLVEGRVGEKVQGPSRTYCCSGCFHRRHVLWRRDSSEHRRG